MLQISRSTAERHLAVLRKALDSIRQRQAPHPSYMAWPPGLDRSLLLQLPLHKRTRNCIITSRLASEDGPLDVGDLMELKNFGRTSLRDLLLTLENFLQECLHSGASESAQAAAGGAPPDSASGGREAPLPWDELGDLLQPLLSAAAEFHGTATPAEALSPRIARLADILGILPQIQAIRIEDLVDDRYRLSSAATRKAVNLYESLSETRRTIVDYRILASPPKTLSRIGSFLDLTRERVRQVQVLIEKRIDAEIGAELRVMALAAKEQLGHVAKESDVDAYLQALLPETTPGGMLVRKMLTAKLGYTKQSGVYLDETAIRTLAGIRASASERAEDAGLVDEKQIMETLRRKLAQSPADVAQASCPP